MPSTNRMNVEKFQKEANQKGLSGVLAVSPNSVYYSTGALVQSQKKTSPQYSSRLIDDRPAYALLNGAGSNTHLIVSEIEKSLVCENTWVNDVWSYRDFVDDPIVLLAQSIKEAGLVDKRIGIEKAYIRQGDFERLTHLLPQVEFVECDSLWNRVRAIKTPAEIAILKNASNCTEEATYSAFSACRVGWTEKQLGDLMVDNLFELGASSVYICVVGAGQNAMDISSKPGENRLKCGDLVHIDFGGKFGGYGSDFARTAVVGRATTHQRDTYRKYMRAQRRTINFMRPGVRACDVFEFWKKAIADEGFENHFPHAGHGFALGGHDYPMLQPREKAVLEPNMVFCVEPLYKDLNLQEAYHVEDMIVITEGEPEILTDFSSTEQMFTIDWQS